VGQPITSWTVERIDALRQLYADGWSASQVAAKLGGTSRNAVIGKISRLGLISPKLKRYDSYGGNMDGRKAGMVERELKPRKARQSVIRIVPANGNSAKMRVFSSAKTEMSPLRCVEIEPRHIHLMDLEDGDCRYPYGDNPFTFCGHPTATGSYCQLHFELIRGNGSPRERSAVKVSNRILGIFA
jgi:GcrA cell cycle regulator